jgi:hypothetical protein
MFSKNGVNNNNKKTTKSQKRFFYFSLFALVMIYMRAIKYEKIRKELFLVFKMAAFLKITQKFVFRS